MLKICTPDSSYVYKMHVFRLKKRFLHVMIVEQFDIFKLYIYNNILVFDQNSIRIQKSWNSHNLRGSLFILVDHNQSYYVKACGFEVVNHYPTWKYIVGYLRWRKTHPTGMIILFDLRAITKWEWSIAKNIYIEDCICKRVYLI